METLSSVCGVDDWAAICRRAVKDAKAGDHRARTWLSTYLLTIAGARREEPTSVHLGSDDEQNPYLNAPPELVHRAMAALDDVRVAVDEANGTPPRTPWSGN
jgi:hypothetical protein